MRPLTLDRVLMTGISFGESPRWHDGRLWFAHWAAGEIVAVDLDGTSEVVGHGTGSLRLVASTGSPTVGCS